MIEEVATIIETHGDTALVETQRRNACGSCSANKACGTAVLAKITGQKNTQITAINRPGVEMGDRVIIGIHEKAMVRGSLAIYAIPLIALFAGSFIGDIFSGYQGIQHEGFTILLGLLGLVAGFVWVRKFTQKISLDPEYQPVILRKA